METLMNIFNNFIPNKAAKLDFKKPAWMIEEIVILEMKINKRVMKYYNTLLIMIKICWLMQ